MTWFQWMPDDRGIVSTEKELVTNIDTNPKYIEFVLGSNYEFLTKYTEGSKYVYKFKVYNIAEMGTIPIGTLIKGLSAIGVTFGITAMIWFWRDVETKKVEGQITISKEATNQMNVISKDTSLADAGKEMLYEQILRNATIQSKNIKDGSKGSPLSDFGDIMQQILYILIIVIVVYIATTAIKTKTAQG